MMPGTGRRLVLWLLATAVTLGLAIVSALRWPQHTPPTAGTADTSSPRSPAATSTAAPEPAAVARLRELRAQSATFRGTTFVTAIRSAGFVCRGVEGMFDGADDSAWLVACYDMLAYTVQVDAAGKLSVEPVLQYFDNVVPVTRPPPQPPLP